MRLQKLNVQYYTHSVFSTIYIHNPATVSNWEKLKCKKHAQTCNIQEQLPIIQARWQQYANYHTSAGTVAQVNRKLNAIQISLQNTNEFLMT
jgi:hypothetical protein